MSERPKCLRCGADASWIEGRVPDEPTSELAQAHGSVAVASVLMLRQESTEILTAHTLTCRYDLTNEDTMRGIAIKEAMAAKPGFSVHSVIVDIIPLNTEISGGTSAAS